MSTAFSKCTIRLHAHYYRKTIISTTNCKKGEQKSLCFYNIRRVGAAVTTLTVGLAVVGSIPAHEHEQTFVLVIYLS